MTPRERLIEKIKELSCCSVPLGECDGKGYVECEKCGKVGIEDYDVEILADGLLTNGGARISDVANSVKEFAKFLLDKNPEPGIIYKDDIVDYVVEFLERDEVYAEDTEGVDNEER